MNKLKVQKTVSFFLLVSLIFSNHTAFALPSGYVVESGDAQFDTTDPSTLVIHASDHAVINFDSFSIAQNETVRFIQDSSSGSLLSRVTGSSATDIYGTLFSNSTLFLVNQNGINFHEGANIQVNNLIASTLDLQSAMYLNQQYAFEKGLGSNPGKILNEANISAANMALLSESIENKGVLRADLGTVVLGIGEKQTLSFGPNGAISLVIDKGLSDTLNKSITNSGTIQADGGKVLLSAKTFNDTMDTLINNTGILQATRAVERDGKVVFESNTANENSGIINTNLFDERGYTFRNTQIASILGGSAFYDNLDGAANISGSIGSNQSDTGDLIVTGAITLTAGSLTFTADSDNNGVGKFDMNSGTSIGGAALGLTIKTGENSNLYGISIGSGLTLDRAGSNSTPTYTMNGNFAFSAMASLVIGSNTTLNVNGNSITTTALTSALSNSGTLKLRGDETLTGLSNLDLDSGTVEYNGNGASTITLKDFGATDYYNLVINTTNSAGTIQMGAAATIAGALTVTSGTLDTNSNVATVTGLVTINGGTFTNAAVTPVFNGGLTLSSGAYSGAGGADGLDINGAFDQSGGTFTAPGTMSVSGDFTHSSGTFSAGTSSITLDGTDQIISGNTTFYDLTKSVAAARTLTFASGSTTTVTGLATLTGAASNLLTLTSSGTWSFDPQGTKDIQYVNVVNSTNLSGTVIYPTNSTDGGGNSNWFSAASSGGGGGAVVDDSPIRDIVFFQDGDGMDPGDLADEDNNGIDQDNAGDKHQTGGIKGGPDKGFHLYGEGSEGIFGDETKIDENIISMTEVTEGAVYIVGIDGSNEMVYDGESMSVSKKGASLLKRGIYVSTLEGVVALRGRTYEKMKEFKWKQRPSALAASKSGDSVYASDPQSSELIQVDTRTFDLKNIKGLNEGANSIVLNQKGDTAFVTDARKDKVQIFNTKTQKILKDISVGSMPTQAVLSSDEKYLYVVERLDATLSKYDAATGKKIASVKAGISPYGAALSRDARAVYVTDTMDNKVLVFNESLKKQAEIPVGKNPYAIVADPKENKVYVTNRSEESISIIDSDRKELISTVPVGKRPSGIAILPEGDKLYVANELSNSLSVVDLKQQRTIKEIPTGTAPNQVVISSPQIHKKA